MKKVLFGELIWLTSVLVVYIVFFWRVTDSDMQELMLITVCSLVGGLLFGNEWHRYGRMVRRQSEWPLMDLTQLKEAVWLKRAYGARGKAIIGLRDTTLQWELYVPGVTTVWKLGRPNVCVSEVREEAERVLLWVLRRRYISSLFRRMASFVLIVLAAVIFH